jgi:hypothetical protein
MALKNVQFMLECGIKSNRQGHWTHSPLLYICVSGILKMDDLPLILNLVEVTGPLQCNFPSSVFSTAPYYVNLKHNLRLLLSQDEECMYLYYHSPGVYCVIYLQD